MVWYQHTGPLRQYDIWHQEYAYIPHHAERHVIHWRQKRYVHKIIFKQRQFSWQHNRKPSDRKHIHASTAVKGQWNNVGDESYTFQLPSSCVDAVRSSPRNKSSPAKTEKQANPINTTEGPQNQIICTTSPLSQQTHPSPYSEKLNQENGTTQQPPSTIGKKP